MSIIVGLYDDLSTIQQVVEDLKQNGFSEQNMHLATYDQRMRQQGSGLFDSLTNLFGREPKYTSNQGQDLVQQMTSWGIPDPDARSYAEALRRGSSLLMVNAPQDQSTTAKRIMDGYDPVDLDERVSDWQAQGYQGYNAEAAPYSQEEMDRERNRYTSSASTTTNRESEQHIPIVEEEMRVGKRAVQKGGVRVHTVVTEQPIEETHTVRDETVQVERRPADREATAADLDAAFRDQTYEVTETDEELITDKRARVTGEVVVSKQVEEHPETVRDTVRRTEVQTEDMGARQTSRTTRDFSSFDTDFRSNYDLVYGSRGGQYSQYEPAYRYGYDLAGMDRYRGKKWSDIEMNARQDWERNHANSRWDDFKDAIRHGWERVSSGSSAADTGTGFTGSEGFDEGTGRYTDTNNP
jgi:uncharacterized protein (TIGR02271 family)